MKIQYLGYLLIVAAFIVGYKPFHPLFILVLALLSTLAFASARAKANKADTRGLRPNPIADGAYLFAGQALIMFTVYIFGYFISTSAGSFFIDFFTGGGRG